MAKDLAAGNHAPGDARKAQSNFHMGVPGIFAQGAPTPGQDAEVLVAADERIGNAEDDGAEPSVGATWQAAVGVIDLVALIATGKQPGAAGDGTHHPMKVANHVKVANGVGALAVLLALGQAMASDARDLCRTALRRCQRGHSFLALLGPA